MNFIHKRPLFSLLFLISIFIISLISPYKRKHIESYDYLNKEKIIISGFVDDIQYQQKNGILRQAIYLKKVKGNSIPNITSVIIYTKSPDFEPAIGSYIKAEGTVKCFEKATNEGMFDALIYYNTIGISFSLQDATIINTSATYSKTKHFFYSIRRQASDILDNTLNEDNSSIMKTMLLGEKWQLDDELKNLYQRNGIAHILAISGLHISLLGSLIYKLFKKIGISQPVSILLSTLFMFSYGLMTGFSISAVRAIIMYAVSMLALLLHRTPDLLTSVSLALVVMLIKNPLYIYNSGFIFSFGCVFGIAVVSPTLLSDNMSFIVKTMLSSLTMLVISFPLYYWTSYQIPVYSILLNFLVIPTMGILFPTGILLIGSHLIFPLFESIFSTLISGILYIFTYMATFFENMPFHYYTPGKPSTLQLLIYLTIIFLLMVYSKKIKLSVRYFIVLIAILFLTLRIHPHCEIDFIDVGQGDGIFIRSSNSYVSFPGFSKDLTILIDGGSSSVKKVGSYRLIPFLKYKGAALIDAVFISHPDKDHMNGILELIESAERDGIKIKSVYINKPSDALIDDNYISLVSLCKTNNIPVYSFYKGSKLEYKDIYIKALSPEKNKNTKSLNESSSVLLLKYNNISALFTGDIEGHAEDMLIETLKDKQIKDITILKVAHHGSKSSSSQEFILQCKPRLSVISVGKDNIYGHPHVETINNLSKVNSQILQTSTCGQITLKTNGRKLYLSSFQKLSTME